MNRIWMTKTIWNLCDGIRSKRKQKKVKFDEVIKVQHDCMGIKRVENAIYVVFSASDDFPEDWVGKGGNLRYFPVDNLDRHSGFRITADRFDEILAEKNFDDNALKVFGGHSRGAATSVYCSVEMLENLKYSSDKLVNINFGCPPTGRALWTQRWYQLGAKMYRYVAGNDVVTHLGMETLGGMHIGEAIALEVPEWTKKLPDLKCKFLPYKAFRYGLRGLVQHSYYVYTYGVNKL